MPDIFGSGFGMLPRVRTEMLFFHRVVVVRVV